MFQQSYFGNRVFPIPVKKSYFLSDCGCNIRTASIGTQNLDQLLVPLQAAIRCYFGSFFRFACGPTCGPTFRPTSGPMPGATSGPTSGPTSGQLLVLVLLLTLLLGRHLVLLLEPLPILLLVLLRVQQVALVLVLFRVTSCPTSGLHLALLQVLLAVHFLSYFGRVQLPDLFWFCT